MATWEKILTDNNVILDTLGDFSRGTLLPIDDDTAANHYATLMPNIGDWYYRTGATNPEIYIRQEQYLIQKLDTAGGGWIAAYNFTPTTIAVTSPDGGDSNLYAGVTHTITWSVTNLSGEVVIQLYNVGATSYSPIATVASTTDGSNTGTGSYAWTIPSGTTPDTDYKIYIRDDSVADGASPGDYSDSDFTIIQPLYTVVSPDGSETFQAGSAQKVEWRAYGGSGKVEIDLLKAGGSPYSIADNWDTTTDNTLNEFDFYIPDGQTAGTDYTVQVTDTNHAYSDVSGGDFTITALSMAIVAPLGGDEWMQGVEYTVSWSSSSRTNPVKITLKNTSGAISDYVFIASTADALSHQCLVPVSQEVAGNYTIRVEKAGDPSIYGDSNAFSVTSGSTEITFTSPTSGTTYNKGSNYSNFCQWDEVAIPNTDTLKFDLYKNDILYYEIRPSIENTGALTWQVGYSYDANGNTTWESTPNGNDYQIKLTDNANALNTGMSPEFTVYNVPVYYPDCENVWVSETEDGEHYTPIALVGAAVPLYGRCSYDFDSSGYVTGYPRLKFKTAANGTTTDGYGNLSHDFISDTGGDDDYTFTAQFNLKKTSMGIIKIDWNRNSMQWHYYNVSDDAGFAQYVTFGQYHVWGATETMYDNPDTDDLDNGSKEILTVADDHTHFGGGAYDAKQITVEAGKRAFFAFEYSLGSLVEYQTSASGTDWSTQPWIEFTDPGAGGGVVYWPWDNGTGHSQTFRIYYTGTAGQTFQAYYRVRGPQ